MRRTPRCLHVQRALGVDPRARWARDQLNGEENLDYYTENTVVPLGFNAAAGTSSATPGVGTCTAGGTVTTASSLAATNQAFGYLAADGTILNPQRLLPAGIPTSIGLWRAEERKDDDITWRVNIDFTPTDNDLIYLSATKGSRAGGFNLVFFSANRSFKTESLISYELGYKGTLRDGTMQLNSAVYYYDYKNVETFGTGPSAFNPADTSTSVFSVPSAHDRRLGHRPRLADHRQPHAGCQLQLHAQRVHRQLRRQRPERSEPAAVVVRSAEHPDRSRRQADAAGAGDEGRHLWAIHLADGRPRCRSRSW